MKIYAVRDRLIDYFMVPFVAPDDNQVMASISQEVSRPDNPNAIASAPHHFEIWKLGEISEDGHIKPGKELVCDVSTLVRVRRETTESAANKAAQNAGASAQAINGSGGNARADSTSV